MAELWRGAPVAAAIMQRAAAGREALRERGVVPTLAIVRVGEREDDIAYERGASKRCESAGVAVRRYPLPAACTQRQLLEAIDEVNRDYRMHGLLLLRPLPQGIDDAAVCRALLPEKDVDGITQGSLAGVFCGTGQGFPPCTARACIELLNHYGVDIGGKRAVVVGRSLVVGRPLAMLLLQRNATVTLCHTQTVDLPAVCRQAEILIAAAGVMGMIGSEYLTPGQIVVDVGIHVREDGSLCGDVDADAAASVQALTPVPGGVGTVTSSVLAAHVIQAALRAENLPDAL